ncbi:MAG: hypothetical protein A2754_03570 [Candidatus Magasanikbacteria bacterium RIFCSPHIGHO2_01_FULL_47_8]|uniref:DoxX family protein n=1 Tax=Candidatus Magasanikbacteria bacterium RIFCSPHIGHO2_01_FULL_47_8 TaxID=1798673 RepID=A0A1F6MCU0_9BACT|nr:MAG: hypothetical protein A2754_03570 [Candidatus Magasanikbacteria bacterium RIFCSPHIGHO2_01_FULL_47_8]
MCKSACTHPTLKAVGLLGLRVAIAFIFVMMGYYKLGPNHMGTVAMFAGLKFPMPEFWAYFVGGAELLGGIMVLLGVYVRYAATWLAIVIVVAILSVHRGGPLAGYFLPAAVLGGCLALLGVGAGPWRLVKTQCHCPGCRKPMEGEKGGCCGGSCGGSCGGDKMMQEGCGCKDCCSGHCACGHRDGCACCK